MTLPFDKKLILLFSIIFIGIIAVGVATFRYHESIQDVDSLVKHNREVLYESERVLSTAQDIVLCSRGYIITGDSSFLQPFMKFKSIISEHVNSLKNLTKGIPSQEQRTDSLEKLINERIDFSIQIVQLRNQKGFAETQELVASGKGKHFMDEIRNTVFSLQQEENDLLREQTVTLDKSTAAFNRSFFALLGSIFILLIIVFFTIRRNLYFKKKIEETLRESLKETSDYKYALDESTIVAITDQKGIIKKVNDNFCKISKYTKEELIGQDHRIVNSGYHPEEFIRDLWVTIANGKIWKGELKNKAKDGTIYWVDTTIVPFLNEQGKPYQYLAIRADITERKRQTEELLQVNKELVRKNIFFNQSLDMLCTATLEGFFQDMNDSFERELGYSKEELKASPFVIFTHPDDVEKTLSEVEKLADGEITLNFENRYRCKNGNYIWMQWNTVLFENLLYATARNITLQKNQQDELVNQTLKLEQANQELESFTYSVSHDLQAPLRILNGYANILKKKCDNILDDEAKSLLDTIMGNAKNMGQLIDDLLKLSNVGMKELEKRSVDMNKLVEAVLSQQLPSIKESTIEIITDTLPPAKCDPSLIRQVWVNLITNAIKYSSKKEQAKIEISCIHQSDGSIYSIKDNGVGFDMKYADKVFNVFQRLHSSAEFEGTGVGLAIVHRIVAKHGGKIWVEAEVGKGAAFYFNLAA